MEYAKLIEKVGVEQSDSESPAGECAIKRVRKDKKVTKEVVATPTTVTPATPQEQHSNRQRDELVILHPLIHSLYQNQLPDSRHTYQFPREEVVDHKATTYHSKLIEQMRLEQRVMVMPLHTTGGSGPPLHPHACVCTHKHKAQSITHTQTNS